MDELEPIILLIVSGLLLRFSLTFTGQAWAKSHAQTVTFMVLPIITYVITKTISGNIALSLGMIGALSIVRFRHPVKSALELVIYFALIIEFSVKVIPLSTGSGSPNSPAEITFTQKGSNNLRISRTFPGL